jgi:hypothetical protein
MPAILLPALEDVWLDPRMTDPAEALTLLTPYPADAMMVVVKRLRRISGASPGAQPMSSMPRTHRIGGQRWTADRCGWSGRRESNPHV